MITLREENCRILVRCSARDVRCINKRPGGSDRERRASWACAVRLGRAPKLKTRPGPAHRHEWSSLICPYRAVRRHRDQGSYSMRWAASPRPCSRQPRSAHPRRPRTALSIIGPPVYRRSRAAPIPRVAILSHAHPPVTELQTAGTCNRCGRTAAPATLGWADEALAEPCPELAPASGAELNRLLAAHLDPSSASVPAAEPMGS